jgi:hypothetical protein
MDERPGWGWEAHELEQARRLASLSLAEKLAWLEEAHRIVLHLDRQRVASAEREPVAETVTNLATPEE